MIRPPSQMLSGRPVAAREPPGCREWLPRGAWVFLGKLLCGYGLLLLLWLPLGAGYRQVLIAAGNAVFAGAGAEGETTFSHHADWRAAGITERADLAVLVRRSAWVDGEGRKQHVLAKAVSTFYQPFTALCFLGALCLATAMSWRRRVLKLSLAAVVLHGWMLACVVIDRSHVLATYGGERTASTRWGNVAVNVLHATVTDWPAGVFIVPLIIWAGIFRGELSQVFFRADAQL